MVTGCIINIAFKILLLVSLYLVFVLNPYTKAFEVGREGQMRWRAVKGILYLLGAELSLSSCPLSFSKNVKGKDGENNQKQ